LNLFGFFFPFFLPNGASTFRRTRPPPVPPKSLTRSTFQIFRPPFFSPHIFAPFPQKSPPITFAWPPFFTLKVPPFFVYPPREELCEGFFFPVPYLSLSYHSFLYDSPTTSFACSVFSTMFSGRCSWFTVFLQPPHLPPILGGFLSPFSKLCPFRKHTFYGPFVCLIFALVWSGPFRVSLGCFRQQTVAPPPFPGLAFGAFPPQGLPLSIKP